MLIPHLKTGGKEFFPYRTCDIRLQTGGNVQNRQLLYLSDHYNVIFAVMFGAFWAVSIIGIEFFGFGPF